MSSRRLDLIELLLANAANFLDALREFYGDRSWCYRVALDFGWKRFWRPP